MVTGLVLVKYQSFNGGIVLTNLAYEIALTIREAQTYGINVKGQVSNFNLSYGVHLDTSSPTSFIMFADNQQNTPDQYGIRTGDGKYDGGSSSFDINVDTFMLKRGIVINKFCVGVSPEICSSSGSGSKLDITFNRPDPSAIINYYDGSGNWSRSSSARIQVIATGNNAKKDIIVQSTGQILIQDGK